MGKNAHILLAEGLTKDFIGLRALSSLDITAKREQIHGLIGPNDSGKTTFFNVITGLLPAIDGKIYLNSTDITNLKPNIIADIGVTGTNSEGNCCLCQVVASGRTKVSWLVMLRSVKHI